MSSAAQDLLFRHVDQGTIPGGIIALGDGPEPEVAAVGMDPDAIVRVQSMTKAVTTIATLRLVEAGRLTLDRSVVEWLPELAERRVLSGPTAELDDTAAARHDITVWHLLTSTSGYGMILDDSPLQRAMSENHTAAGPEPVALGADEWIRALADLPLAFQPGEGWRYHHSYGLLGTLLSRLTGRPLGEHLTDDLFTMLGATDTGYFVPQGKVDRLPAAYHHESGPGDDDRPVEIAPAGAGFYAGPPPFDVSHAELVSTARDYYRIARVVATGGLSGERRVISSDHAQQMTTDQVPSRCKTADSFFPNFWDDTGWGFGGAITTGGPRRGRFGWAGGLGTTFFVDPDGTVGVLLTQVEMGPQMFQLIEDFQDLHTVSVS